MELNGASMKNKLVNKMGLLAIQIKQHQNSVLECEAEYEKLSAQVSVLQELENSGVDLNPKPAELDKQQEQT